MSRPPLPAPPHKGACLCGQVRIALNAQPLAINACHCIDCKKLTGATHLLVLHARREAFEVVGETQTYVKRADSGREVEIVRCAICGVRTHLLPRSAPELVIISAGVLDDPSWCAPTSHIWTEKAEPYVRFTEDAIQLEGKDVQRPLLWAHFEKLYPQ